MTFLRVLLQTFIGPVRPIILLQCYEYKENKLAMANYILRKAKAESAPKEAVIL